MKRINELIAMAAPMNAVEQSDMVAAAEGMRLAHFDTDDIKRIVLYRRAVRAGYFTDKCEGQFDMAEQIAGNTDWVAGFKSWAARQSMTGGWM